MKGVPSDHTQVPSIAASLAPTNTLAVVNPATLAFSSVDAIDTKSELRATQSALASVHVFVVVINFRFVTVYRGVQAPPATLVFPEAQVTQSASAS